MRDNLEVPCATPNCWQRVPDGTLYCPSCARERQAPLPLRESSGLWFAKLPANQEHYRAAHAALLADLKGRRRRAGFARLATLTGTVLLLTGVATQLAPLVGLGLLALVAGYAKT